MGNLVRVGRVLLNYGLARLFPSFCVPRIVQALGSEDPDTSEVAYMALVKLGTQIQALLCKEAREGRHAAHILQILGDQGDEGACSSIQEFLDHADTEVAAAAREALQALRQSPSCDD